MNWSRRALLLGLGGSPGLVGCIATSEAPQTPADIGIHLPGVVRQVLPSGTQLYVVEDHSVPLVAIAVAVRAGFRDDDLEHAGLAALVAALIAARSEIAEVQARYAALGSKVDIRVEPSLVILCCTVHRDHSEQALRFMVEDLRHATTDPEVVKRVQAQLRSELEATRGDLKELAAYGLVLGSHGGETPATALRSGSVGSINTLNHDLVRDWRRRNVRPERLTFALTGDTTSKRAEQSITSALGDWEGDPAVKPEYEEAERNIPAPGPGVVFVSRPGIERAVIAFGGARRGYGDPGEFIDLRADFCAGSYMNHSLRTLQRTSYGVQIRLLSTRYGQVRQLWTSLDPQDLVPAVDTLWEFSSAVLDSSQHAGRIVAANDRMGAGDYVDLMAEFSGAERSLEQVLSMAAGNLPPTTAVSRFEHLSALGTSEVTAALQHHYGFPDVRVCVVADDTTLRGLRKQLGDLGEVIVTANELVGVAGK